MIEGLDDQAIVSKIVSENLFQYPTERTLRSMALVCVARLRGLNNDALIDAVANRSSEVAKQICLYGMMKKYRLVWDFMIGVIGEKYRRQDFSFGKLDLNVFFLQLQEQDDKVAGWSDSTVKKIAEVLKRLLLENGYLDNSRSTRLNPVLLDPVLESAIKTNGDHKALPAFNSFS